MSIPAIYQGKVIELTGFLKLENVRDGSAGLLLRVDGRNGTLQSETQRIGVKIDIPMKPTLKGIISGRDELLKKQRNLS